MKRNMEPMAQLAETGFALPPPIASIMASTPARHSPTFLPNTSPKVPLDRFNWPKTLSISQTVGMAFLPLYSPQ